MARTVVLSLLVLTGAATAQPGTVGTPAADFSLQDILDDWYTLSEHQGEVVVLNMMGWG